MADVITEIQALLESGYVIDVEVDRMAKDKQSKIDSILTPELRQQIKDIEEEYAPYMNTASNNKKKYHDEARAKCLALGETVNATHYQVVWNKGRSGIDADAKEAYFLRHHDDEEVKALFKTGDPYASIKAITPKEDKPKK
jgi:hypothetical protein